MKKTLAIILSIIMLISVCPVAFAADSVSYVNRSWNETTNAVVSETKTVDTYTVVSSSTTTMSSGWYVVNSNVTVADRITVSGTVNLILCDGYTLTASKGIYLASGNSLTIYGQANDSGALSATATTSEEAGIGGKYDVDSGTLIICGGNVTAKGAVDAAGIGGGYWSSNGTVSIYGGTVTANGGSGGAGIGGGMNDSARVTSSGGNISIYGGTVTANSGKNGAGIGGGKSGPAGSISIYGGTVTATATGDSKCGAGIGGGENGSSETDEYAVTGTISIYGGTVTANGGIGGAGIGGGIYGTVDSVTIRGGTVTAKGGTSAAGIGGGQYGNGASVIISGGTVTAKGGTSAAGIGGGSYGNGASVIISGGTVSVTGGGDNGAGIGGGMNRNGGNVTITGGSIYVTAGKNAEKIGKGYNGTSSGTLTNGTADVSGKTLTLSGAANVNIASMSGLSGYGLKDVKTDANGKLYFYLPANTALPTSLTTADGTIFSNNGSGNYTEHVHSFADATCTEPKTCSCGITEGSALGHDWSDNNGICKNDNTHLCNHAGYESASLCGICGKILHQHSYTYTANGSKITATCVGEGTCPDTEGGMVTISAENATYTGKAIENAKLAYSNNWVGARDLVITYENNEAPGTATASVTVGDVVASVDFEIAPCPHNFEGRFDDEYTCTLCGTPHAHEWSYTDGEFEDAFLSIVVACETEGCTLEDRFVKALLPESGEFVYNGSEQYFTFDNTIPGAGYDYSYAPKGGEAMPYGDYPMDAGEYTFTLSYGDLTLTKDYTIAPKPLTVDFISAFGKEYDGTNIIDVDDVTLAGLESVDDNMNLPVYVPIEGVQAILADSVPGRYETATVTGLTLTGDRAFNYTIADTVYNVTGPHDTAFYIHEKLAYVNALDQYLKADEELDQTAFATEGLAEGHTVTGVQLVPGEYDETVIDVKIHDENWDLLDTVKVYDAEGNDVTHFYTLNTQSARRITICDNHKILENGFCQNEECMVYEPATLITIYDEYDSISEQYYEIANAGQLYWFAEQVNEYGKNDIAAKLMADIVVNETLDENARPWKPIGGLYADFDGQGHVISGLYCVTEGNYAGFYGYGGYYTIKNLGISNSYFEGGYAAGAFAGYAQGSIINCYVDDTVTVKAGTYSGMLMGTNASTGYVENCFAYGPLVGYNYMDFYNCYYVGEDDGIDGTTIVTVEELASGEIAYLLQDAIVGEPIYDEYWNEIGTEEPAHVWGQKIGEDRHPVLGGEKVYYSEELGYYNEIHEHTWKDGVCTDCDTPCEHIGTATELVGYAAPSCTEAGYEGDIVCECGLTTVPGNAIPATGHNENGEVPSNEATCTSTGIAGGKYCTVCDEGREEAEAIIPMEEHIMETPATCTRGAICEKCHNEYGEKNPENHADNKTVDDNNCTTAFVCSECGETLVEAAEDHIERTPANCLHGAICDTCGMEYTVPKYWEHTWVNSQCTVCLMYCDHPSFDAGICSECGYLCVHESITPIGTCYDCYATIFNKLPTSADPSVELAIDAQNVSYQWNSYTKTELTDQNANIVDYGEDGKSSYTAANGWTGASLNQSPPSSDIFALNDSFIGGSDVPSVELGTGFVDYCTLTLNAGDVIAANTEMITLVESETYKNYRGFSFDDSLAYVVVPADGEYLIYGEVLENVRLYRLTKSAIAGATTNTLANPVLGTEYSCTVTFDGITTTVGIFEYTYFISKQPDATDLTVTINPTPETATYKWYRMDWTEVTDQNATVYAMDDLTAAYAQDAGWTGITPRSVIIGPAFPVGGGATTFATNGREPAIGVGPSIGGTSGPYYYCTLDLNEGDVLAVHNSNNMAGLFDTDSGAGDQFYPEVMDGVIYCTAPYDGNFAVVGNAEQGVRIYIQKKVELTGENTATLQNPVLGNEYVCEVTVNGAKVLETERFTYKKVISHQPTAEESYVELNIADAGATYQWYSVAEGTVAVTDENADTEVGAPLGAPAGTLVSRYEDGKWLPAEMDTNLYFTVEAKAGDVLTVTFAEAVDFGQLLGVKGIVDGVVSGNVVTFTIERDDTYTLVGIHHNDATDYSATATITGMAYTAVDGATSAAYIATAIGTYACEVTFSDGTTEMSDTFEVTEINTECDEHSYSATVTTRPTKNEDNTWTQGILTYTCSVCSDTYTESVDRADYTAYDVAVADLESLLETKDLCSFVPFLIETALAENEVAQDLVESEDDIDLLESKTAGLESAYAEINTKIESEEYIHIDLSELEAKLAELEAYWADSTINNVVTAAGIDLYNNPNSYYQRVKDGYTSKPKNPDQYDVNTQVGFANSLLAGLKDGTYLRLDLTELLAQADEWNAVQNFAYNITVDQEFAATTSTTSGLRTRLLGDSSLSQKDWNDDLAMVIDTINRLYAIVEACANGEHTAGEAVTENEVEADCTTDGSYDTVTYCVYCGDVASRVTTPVPALGHDYIMDDDAIPPTCTEDGFAASVGCTRCDYEETDAVIPALGHDIVIDKGYAATCTEEGLTDGSHCSRCDDATVAQTAIPAQGHNTNGYITPVAATCTATGIQGGTYCDACDEGKAEAEKVLDMIAHNTNGTVAHVDASCTTNGVQGGTYCDVCDLGKAEAEKVIPVTGHGKTEIVGAKEATATEDGYTGDTYCTVCDNKIADGKVIPATGTQTPDEPEVPDEPDEPAEECDHNCHSDNFVVRIFWRIINFFNRFFNRQQYCDCGELHYEEPIFTFLFSWQ